MKRCRLCIGQITEKDLIHINVYRCSYCEEEQEESDLIMLKECTKREKCVHNHAIGYKVCMKCKDGERFIKDVREKDGK